MKAIHHGALESGSNVLYTKGNYLVCECFPRGGECNLVMIFFLDMNLVVSEKSIHERKYLMSSACINDLVNEGCWEVVFGTCPIHITEVCANADGTGPIFYS